MKQKHLKNLEELENEVNELRSLIKSSKHYESQVMSKTLFRGHANDKWELETTLERFTSKNFSIASYNNILWAINPAISSFTGKDWTVERDKDVRQLHFSSPPNYEFMAYARHHGFPSPLLDWSQSFYVALFFAFQKANPSDQIAIFVYIESLVGGKAGWEGGPQIHELGPYIKTHQRHFSQQGQYTVAVKKEGDHWIYCPHRETFNKSEGKTQDLLYKFTLPGSLKDYVLSKLQEMNINAFTLYSSEESLMEMLAYKEITLSNI